jgi:subtilisin family serine protease
MLEKNVRKNIKFRLYKRQLLQATTCTVLGLLLLSTSVLVATMPQRQSALAQPQATQAPPTQGSLPIPPTQGGLPLTPNAQPPPEATGGITSVPQVQDRAVANLPSIPEATAPGGQLIEGQYIALLKAPAPPTTQQQAQQALSTLAQEAENIATPLEAAGANVTELPNIGAVIIRTEGGGNQTGQAAGLQAGAAAPQEQQLVQQLEANPNVADVFQDRTVTIDVQTLPTGIGRIDADWTPRPGRSGDGRDNVDADIAIIDTGAQPNHPDLNVVRCVGFGFPNCNDGHGHGTHVAGTAAARDNNIGVVGVAPGARIWAIKVLSDVGEGTFANILAGINYVFANRAQIESVNLSLGCHGTPNAPCTFPPVEQALRQLALFGVTVAVSAGNNGQDAQFNTPARAGIAFPGVITVSNAGDSDGRCGGFGPNMASSSDDQYSRSSAFNNDNMAAPGVNILSTYKNGGLAVMSGTSMASPHVAGAAAYYKSLFPAMTPAQIEAALKTTDTKRPPTANVLFPCDGHGRGYVRESAIPHNHREPLLYMGLTGVYRNNDGGLYYFRQNGPVTLYWAGLSQNGQGAAFTNIYKGTSPDIIFSRANQPIIGPSAWCDIPRGFWMSCGNLTIRMTSITTFARTADGGNPGNFGGSTWTKLP